MLIFEQQSCGMRSGFQYRDSDPTTHGSEGKSAVLEVSYHTGSGGPSELLTGLRFQNVSIPQGATILNASIDFTPSVGASGATTFNVQVQNSDHAEGFSSADGELTDAINRPRYADVVPWSVTDDWIKDQPLNGPDVTSWVQAVVNRGGWCGNNAMAFFLTGSSQINRYFYSYEAGDDREPKLSVEYTYDSDTAPPGSGCINAIIPNYTASSEQDAVEGNAGNNAVSIEDEALLIDRTHRVGIRFRQFPIKQGATIVSAYLKVYAHPARDNAGNFTVRVEGHDIDDSPAYPASRSNITNRARTSANVDWATSAWIAEAQYTSGDIKSVVQEVVNRPGWAAGNALSLILSSSSAGERQFYSWDGNVGKSAQLVVQVANGGFDASSNTARNNLNAVVQSYEALTEVPLVDTLYEAVRYYRGDSVYYGSKRELFPPQADNTDARYKRVSHADSYAGGSHSLPPACPSSDSNATACEPEEITGSPTYVSPSDNACQSNHIVILTNGLPTTGHQQSRDGINAWTSGWAGRSCETDSSRNSERCSRDLVEWIANVDQKPSIAGYDNVINTHTIALNVNSTSFRDYLQDLASLGGGFFKEANSSAELATAFDDILQSIKRINTTFVAPGATINQFNRLSHRDEVYFSLFRPDRAPMWAGNLKRYRLLGNPPRLVDVNDEQAVDPATGFFKETARSFWSDQIDGNDVSLGGAAYELPEPNLRKAYTYLSSEEDSSVDLTNLKNLLHEDNEAISHEMLGVETDADRNQLLRWARGMDINDWDADADTAETRLQMGDPLHSIPTLVTYDADQYNPEIIVFLGTNEGFLHAIDASEGEEVFSFIPEELLGNLEHYYENDASFDRPYGLDGSPVAWVNDKDYDGVINNEDHVYLYIGMRRGGQNYYALDVTNVNSPRVLWTIEGGTGDFAQLGQTWSRPVKTKIKIGETPKDVLIFTGGYDPAQDETTTITPDSIGNAIYIVDAVTGNRLWAGYDGASVLEGEHFPQMDFSIPGDISVVDINKDGLADQLYAADVGGQVWRLDIANGEPVSSLINGGVIARLSGSGEENARRFFNKPNVALISQDGKQKIAVTIGSGTRFNPLNRTIIDRFYMLFLDAVYRQPATYTALTEANLVDRTNSISGEAIDNGWYITLPNTGEKVLANSVTVNNTVFFTTYAPDASDGSCQAVLGQGRTYAVKVFNGDAAFDLNNDETIDSVDDRVRLLGSGAIPPSPKLLITEDGGLTLLVGPEQPYGDVDISAIRTDRWFNSYWYERDEAIP